jgi:hypothetical protein
VLVPDQASVLRLGTVITTRDGFSGFTGRFDETRWCADLGDLVLTVATREGTDQAEHDTTPVAMPDARPDARPDTEPASPEAVPVPGGVGA